MRACGIALKKPTYEDEVRSKFVDSVRRQQIEKFDDLYSDLWDQIAELIGSPTDDYAHQSQEDQFITRAFAHLGGGSQILEATRHALMVMRQEDDFKLISQAIEPVLRYGVKRLFELIQASLDKQSLGVATQKASLLETQVEGKHQDSVERSVGQERSVSFSISPSPEPRKPTPGQVSSIFKQPDPIIHSYKKNGPRTVQKPIPKNQVENSSHSKLHTARTNKKQKHPVKNENFGSKDTGCILGV